MCDEEKSSNERNKPERELIPSPSPPPAPNSAQETTHAQTRIAELEKEMGSAERGVARWSKIVAVFTGVLALIGVFQFYAFVESERAYLIARDISFVHGEPTTDPDGLDVMMALKNVGKHTGVVTEFAVKPIFFTKTKNLPSLPPYEGGLIYRVVPPIAPGEQVTINIHSLGIRAAADGSDLGVPEAVAKVMSGDIPLRVIGFANYDIGYTWFRLGRVGYCFEYVPAKRRIGSAVWETCDNPNYTYTR